MDRGKLRPEVRDDELMVLALLLVVAACTSTPATPPASSGRVLGAPHASSQAPSNVAQPGAPRETPARPGTVPEGADEQLLKLAVMGQRSAYALEFRNRSLLTTSNHALELGPNGLKPLSADVLRDLVGDPALATTGEFPERAFVLTPEYVACTLPDKNTVRRWTGKRWAPVPASGADSWPQEQVVDLCSWGQYEVAVRLYRWYEEPITSRFEVIDESGVSAPVFEPAPKTDAYQTHHCETRLVAQRCAGLPSGTIVVAGSLCDESGPAVEYFKVGSLAGTVVELPPAEAPASFELTHVSVQDEVVYIAGKQGSPERGYLARFSPSSGAERLPLPKSAQGSVIRDLVATHDGSLWVNASPAVQGDVVALGLWRRDPSGVWHRQLLPPDLPLGPQRWTFSPWANNNLLGAWGEVWLNATFYNGDPIQKGTLSQELILTGRSDLTPLMSRTKPRVLRSSSPVAAPTVPIPCGP